MNTENPARKPDEIQAWLLNRIAEAVNRPPSEISVDADIGRLGLESVTAVIITGELEGFLCRSVSPTLLWDFPTIRMATEHLSGVSAGSVA